ncbi:C-X-C chemokine receptor type 3.1 isoform X2 [Syngnathoides biaculeatus]|uniref:C-X-C chemokine receptor type 3.1 isoform X2 n=1 Tax=Syngnathoides biaculeatus TaxID=300417 RepID=UPI002ADD5061|nr:C-X-C chemokine receptor type 3.1 isoform X2 [Syngnathoides biaculeatus]
MSHDFSLSSLLESDEAITFDLNSWFLEDIDLPEGSEYDSNESYISNKSLASLCDPKEVQLFEAVFIPILYSVSFIVGIVGNGVLLGILARSRKTWSVTDTFILHLALADILLLLTLPLVTAQDVQNLGWTFGTPLCKITGAVFTINFYCGILLLACISLDRYIYIVHATQMYSRRKPWVIQSSCLIVWVLSVLLSVPDWMFLEAVHNARRKKTHCGPSSHSFRLFSRLLNHTVGFLLPLVALIFCYSCILHRLRCSTGGPQKQKAFWVIASVVVVFFLCWTPYNIILIVDTVFWGNTNTSCKFRDRLAKAMIMTQTIGYLHCSLNPILYAFVGVKFRHQLLDILRVLTCKSNKLQSVASGRRPSTWSESADTFNSLAI